MPKKICIDTKDAPAPIGPYSQAVSAANLVFISGQIALVPATGELKTANIQDETHQVMHNIKAILKASGLGF
ncbi:MAG: RidA family protein, partial [Bacteroidetes bacterium]